MSKAFTRESDDGPDFPIHSRPVSALPPGAKNYLTPGGAARLREELERLLEVERPRLSARTQESDTKAQLQALDQRVRQLQLSLHSAVVVAPPVEQTDQVRFGATVAVRNRHGEVSRYRIVGIDEIDLDRNWVSWLSPIAKALLNARIGQRVRFRFPSGEEELEIREITYE
jgi:transcription elongation factor GreB